MTFPNGIWCSCGPCYPLCCKMTVARPQVTHGERLAIQYPNQHTVVYSKPMQCKNGDGWLMLHAPLKINSNWGEKSLKWLCSFQKATQVSFLGDPKKYDVPFGFPTHKKGMISPLEISANTFWRIPKTQPARRLCELASTNGWPENKMLGLCWMKTFT